MLFNRPARFLALALLFAPLCGCARMSDMFGNIHVGNPFAFLNRQKPPSTDSRGNRLSRGIVISVRNVTLPAPPSSGTVEAGGDKARDKTGDDTPGARDGLEYRVLQDDGSTFVIAVPGDETDAITPGQRVLVVHGNDPKVMLETALTGGQGV